MAQLRALLCDSQSMPHPVWAPDTSSVDSGVASGRATVVARFAVCSSDRSGQKYSAQSVREPTDVLFKHEYSQIYSSDMERRHILTAPSRPLVLLVDGRADTLALYALSLSAMGFDVVPAKDGAEACRRAWETHPDIIVTELPMPNYDGRRFLKDLKQNPRTRDIPVVALSGRVEGPSLARTARDGFAAMFVTPCLPHELAEGLRRVLDGKTHATDVR